MRIYYSTFILFFLAQFYRAHAQVQTVIRGCVEITWGLFGFNIEIYRLKNVFSLKRMQNLNVTLRFAFLIALTLRCIESSKE